MDKPAIARLPASDFYGAAELAAAGGHATARERFDLRNRGQFSAHRFRPILLTASAPILGMIPTAPTIFWGPMACAIMGGLAVATLLTLVFLPALCVTWFRIKKPPAEADQNKEFRKAAMVSH